MTALTGCGIGFMMVKKKKRYLFYFLFLAIILHVMFNTASIHLPFLALPLGIIGAAILLILVITLLGLDELDNFLNWLDKHLK
jgi:RsiW-degrading membrane proteinase PrsW (M82 family)